MASPVRTRREGVILAGNARERESAMGSPAEKRASERVPFQSRVKVMNKGRLVAYTLAINLSMGGILLHAGQMLPVGSRCEVSIFPSETKGQGLVLAEGTVVRSDTAGTAIQFASTLATESFRSLIMQDDMNPAGSLLKAYRAHFKVGQSEDLADCEKLLGVSKRTYRTVFWTSFTSCIPLATLPVWLLRESIPAIPIWSKILLSFLYGAVWLLIIQPSIDLTAFRFLRIRKPVRTRS